MEFNLKKRKEIVPKMFMLWRKWNVGSHRKFPVINQSECFREQINVLKAGKSVVGDETLFYMSNYLFILCYCETAKRQSSSSDMLMKCLWKQNPISEIGEMLQPEMKVYFGISVVILNFPYPYLYKERRKQYDADIYL